LPSKLFPGTPVVKALKALVIVPLVALFLIVTARELLYMFYSNPYVSPAADVQNRLKSLALCVEEFYVDYLRYPGNIDELRSFESSIDDVEFCRKQLSANDLYPSVLHYIGGSQSYEIIIQIDPSENGEIWRVDDESFQPIRINP